MAEATVGAGHLRYHALDNLRAAMMLLGIVLHAAISYGVLPYENAWPYKDPSTTPLCDLFVIVVHAFRMPLFFVLAGFFASLLRERRGLGGLLRNRLVRIGLPFAVGWAILFPLVRWGMLFAVSRAGQEIPGLEGRKADPWAAYEGARTIHLWFLHFLLIFYAAAAILVPLAGRLGAGLRAKFSGAFRAVVGRAWARVLAPAGLTFLTLLPMRAGALETSTAFVPDPKVLLAYGLFFGFGWVLYHHRDLLPAFGRRAGLQLGLALGLAFPLNIASVAFLMRTAPAPSPPAQAVAAASGAVLTWLLIGGITGLFLRLADRPMPRVRYLSDASYWMYLVHLPLILLLVGLLAPLPWPALAKLAVVLLLAGPILLASYHYAVRPTALGLVLNGRQVRRDRPGPGPEPTPARAQPEVAAG